MKKYLILICITAILPLLIFAHEGHGHTHEFTITHYFVEPEHLAVILGLFAIAFAYWKYVKKKTVK